MDYCFCSTLADLLPYKAELTVDSTKCNYNCRGQAGGVGISTSWHYNYNPTLITTSFYIGEMAVSE